MKRRQFSIFDWRILLRQAAIALCVGGCVSVAALSGCAQDRAAVDHRAAVMTGLADKINSTASADLAAHHLELAWIVENERRAAVNLSDALHWRKATYPYPAKFPTTLPWTPEDDAPTTQPAGGN